MISIVVAAARNNVIGANNSLIWKISEDLKYFKQLTTGYTIIMGRKTFESIGRALPNRRTIVVTRNVGYHAEGCELAASLQDALSMTKGEEEVFIVGGGQLYKEAFDYAERIYLTRIDKDYEGDTFFPALDSTWQEVARQDFERGETFAYPFSFLVYERHSSSSI